MIYHFACFICQVKSKLCIHFKTSRGKPDIFSALFVVMSNNKVHTKRLCLRVDHRNFNAPLQPSYQYFKNPNRSWLNFRNIGKSLSRGITLIKLLFYTKFRCIVQINLQWELKLIVVSQ